jgi:hypothetical protein
MLMRSFADPHAGRRRRPDLPRGGEAEPNVPQGQAAEDEVAAVLGDPLTPVPPDGQRMFLDARRVWRLDDQDEIEDDRDIRPPPLQRPRLTKEAEARRNSGEPEREVSPPLEAAAPPAQPTLGLQPFLDAELSPLERALLRNQRGNDSTSRGAGVLSRLRTTEGSGANTTTTSRQRSRTPSRPATTEPATAPQEPAPNFDAFVANRTKAFKNKKSRESLGKELRFDKATPRQQQLLLKSREAEWQNWTSYKLVDIIGQEEANQLIANHDHVHWAVPTSAG